MAAENLQQSMEIARRLKAAGRLGEAGAVYQQILQAEPADALAAFGFGEVLAEAGRLQDAAALYRRALQLRPELAECWTALGNLLRETGELDACVAAYQKAVELEPLNASVHNNLGGAFKDRGEIARAITEYHTALSLRPDFTDARLNLGLALLLAGELAGGFALYESRRELREPLYPWPRWKGERLSGQRVLLWTRQGLGDVIQFVRYAPMVAARGGRVVVACKPQLRRLLEGQEGISEAVSDADPNPAADFQCPLLSLPLVFGTTLQTIPARPSMRADRSMVASWRGKFEREPQALRVGLNWAGNQEPRRNRKRTFDLAAMAPLGQISSVRFYSLQKGDPAVSPPPKGLNVIDWTSEIRDMADTAALIANLHLVITCDTSVAHLAGALGTPTWVGLPFSPDWRWLLGRADCPWYPTMRLFRQPAPGDWQTVMRVIASELARVG